MTSDADALPALIDVMKAAGDHDLAAVTAALDAAESHLPKRHHRSRPDIAAAHEAAAAGDWQRVWGLAWAATTGLTFAFPPDVSLCPPLPGSIPYADSSTCTCGADLARGIRFCPHCGNPTDTEPSTRTRP